MPPLLFALLAATPSTDAPADFIDAVRPLFQVVTCQPGPPPPGLDAPTVAAYCAVQQPRFARFREHWGVTARRFFQEVRPNGLPDELVYPFGGGDLMSALLAFPDARVITTLSLELAGDPRRLPQLKDSKALEASLRALSQASASTLMSNDSLSKNLSKTQRGELPGQLSMHLMGLALFDYEPVSVRYFRIEPDGALHYLTLAEVTALEQQGATKLKSNWVDPDFSVAFSHVEVQFVPRGQPDAPRRVHRHIGANLSNEGLALTPGVMAHLGAKGKVAAMTKAASYLLWRDSFSQVRDYLVQHADFMVSDSTGVPPMFWAQAHCRVEAYGRFEKSFLGTWEGFQAALRKQFESARPLPMRFGYPDGSAEKHNHLLVARCLRAK